jgi:O-antigen/teichoic acid export membrane protein
MYKYIFLILFPIILIVILFAKEAIKHWLDPEFALYSTHIMQLIAFGILINGLAQVPFALLQGIGRPDITAKLHLIEFPIYIILFLVLVSNYGIDGAAIAWVVRALMDLIMLSLRTRKLLYLSKLLIRLSASLFGVLLILLLGLLISNIYFKGLYIFLIIAVFILSSWLWILTSEEKEYIKHCVSRSTVLTS